MRDRRKVEAIDGWTRGRARRWLKRQTSKMRRRLERAGYEPRRTRDLTRGWAS